MSDIVWDAAHNQFVVDVDPGWRARIRVSFTGVSPLSVDLYNIPTPAGTAHFSSCLPQGAPPSPVIVVPPGPPARPIYFDYYLPVGSQKYVFYVKATAAAVCNTAPFTDLTNAPGGVSVKSPNDVQFAHLFP